MLPEKRVVTCFLESENRILILRRSERVGTYQGKWAGVSGYIEHDADTQALIEIGEETGLSGDDIELVNKGHTLAFDDEKVGVRWVVHPYLFRVKDREKVKIDWEHKELKWIDPADLEKYETVPKLREALDLVLSYP